MVSFVTIEIDTSSPRIVMHLPRYTVENAVNEITIEASEALDTHQDIYMMDANGEKIPLTFERESDTRYLGLVQFTNVPLGIHTIYAQMRDTVGNLSNIVTGTIEVKDSIRQSFVQLSDKAMRKARISDEDRSIHVVDASRFIRLRNDPRKTKAIDTVRRLKIKDFKK